MGGLEHPVKVSSELAPSVSAYFVTVPPSVLHVNDLATRVFQVARLSTPRFRTWIN